MTNVFRHRRGATEPQTVPVDSATVIEIGDAVYLNTDDALPAGDLAWSTNLAGTQEAFHDVFLGIAMQQSRALDTKDIRIATKGVVEMICASATFEPGDLVGLDDNAGGTALLPQQVIAVATENLAIGRVATRVGSAATVVEVRIVGTNMHGGPQAMA